MGNKPLRGVRRITNGTITGAKRESLQDWRQPEGQGSSDREGSEGTQRKQTRRAPLHKGDSTETSSSATGSSVTEMPIAPVRPRSCSLGNPFVPDSCTELTRHALYLKLIQSRLVNIPHDKWHDDYVYACSIQDERNGYFFSDPYTGQLVLFAGEGSASLTTQSQTTVNFLLYNSTRHTTFPMNLTVFSLNFSHLRNWALTVDPLHSHNGIYDVCFKNCRPQDTPPELAVQYIQTDTVRALTLSQKKDGQNYCFIAMPNAILGSHCSVIKAVHSGSSAAATPALLTMKAPIKF